MVDCIPYDPALTVRAARAFYFQTNGFGIDGGYGKRWVPVKIGPAEFLIRNTASRRRAVRLHDLHHIATGYPTTLEGEALIGAWELGSGCRDHVAAWFLNATAFAFGVIIAPRALWRAFVRGRRSANLFAGEYSDTLLDLTVGQLRGRLGVDGTHDVRYGDVPLFAVWVVVGLYVLGWTVALSPVFFVATVIYKLVNHSP